jgi:hypothetical protein
VPLARAKSRSKLKARRQAVYNLGIRVQDQYQRSFEDLEKKDKKLANSVIQGTGDILERGKSLDESLLQAALRNASFYLETGL